MNKGAVRATERWLDLWREGDANAMAELAAADLQVVAHAAPVALQGDPSFHQLVKQFPTGPADPIRIQADLPRVILDFTLDGQEGPMPGCIVLSLEGATIVSCDLIFGPIALFVGALAQALPTPNGTVLVATAERANRQAFGAGTTVIEEGAEPDMLHVIVEGRAEVLRDGEVIGDLETGQVFGEAGMLARAPRNATVRASEPLVTLAIGREAFDELLGSSPETEAYLEAIRKSRTPAAMQTDLNAYVEELYGSITPAPCPFTEAEIAELGALNELLVYVPADISANEMCRRWDIESNVDFDRERLIRYTMPGEDHWFVASASGTPELIYRSGVAAARAFEDDGLHGMDVRRYTAFAATYRLRFGVLPDRGYWTFLLGGRYDRSGVSIIGFDPYDVLSHHGWMRDFKAKFAGSRYAVLAPRIEVTSGTSDVPRAYRGGGKAGREAGMD